MLPFETLVWNPSWKAFFLRIANPHAVLTDNGADVLGHTGSAVLVADLAQARALVAAVRQLLRVHFGVGGAEEDQEENGREEAGGSHRGQC